MDASPAVAGQRARREVAGEHASRPSWRRLAGLTTIGLAVPGVVAAAMLLSGLRLGPASALAGVSAPAASMSSTRSRASRSSWSLSISARPSKLGTGVVVGRGLRLHWRDSIALGTAFNCRGVTELLVLTTGLTAGLIDGRTYAIFVVMTLVTTSITGPLLGRLALPATAGDP